MCRIEASRQMVTAWVAATRVITLLEMRSSLSRFPGKAKNKINGGTSVPRGCGARRWHAVSVVRDTSSTASVRQFAHRLAGDTVIVFFLPATDVHVHEQNLEKYYPVTVSRM